jgi:hypothetical protein
MVGNPLAIDLGWPVITPFIILHALLALSHHHLTGHRYGSRGRILCACAADKATPFCGATGQPDFEQGVASQTSLGARQSMM